MAEPELPASALVDAIDEALLVVDEDDEIVECNEAFEALLAPADSYTGPIDAILADHPALRDHVERREDGIVTLDADGGTEYYQLSVSPVENGTNRGYELVVLHDVTAHQRQRLELERENEQLDRFARVISHDLRNPLDVAIGRTTVIGELVEDPDIQDHVAEIERAHSRMLRIIDDVLTLARQGQSIDEKHEVDLGAVATDAWSHVETAGATLNCGTDRTVLADPDRLEQVFENLFRNSIEHGADGDAGALTVTVGDLPDGEGFYVADDGVGIPEQVRDEVLAVGFSDRDDGTGLGLGIVSNIADAHQWDIAVRASDEGGARFEFTGVEAVTGVTPENSR